MAKENKLTVEIKTVKEKMLDIMKENQQLKNNIPDDVGNNRVNQMYISSLFSLYYSVLFTIKNLYSF